MKLPLFYFTFDISRGMGVKPEERIKPQNIQDVEEMYEVGYTDLLSYNDDLTLSNTINIESVEKDKKVYINLNNKQKQGIIQKKDIIIPITNVTFEPRFVMWEGDKTLNYIYHQKQIIIRPNPTKIIPEYLFFILNSNTVRNYWREHSKEGNNKFRLVCKTVMNLEIEVPSIEEQKKIVERTINNNKEQLEIRLMYEELSK